jgi:two-component system response regulator FixJ
LKPQDRIIYVVDDDDEVRNALVTLLRWEGLSAEAYASAGEFLDAYQEGKGGCLLLDVHMPNMSGLELQEVLAKQQFLTPVIIMTGHGDVPMAVRAMRAGAFDFIEKPFKDHMLLHRIRLCLSQADKNHKPPSESAERLASLTSREREVMELLVSGKLNKQIAAELSISVRTAEAHRAKIMEKLQAKSLSDVVRIALQS